MEKNTYEEFILKEFNSLNKSIKKEESSLDLIIENNPHIQYFVNYLEENKIDFNFLIAEPKEFLLLKILTLKPKYFLLLLDDNCINKFHLKYEYYKTVKRSYDIEVNKYKFYIIYVKKSIFSREDVLSNTYFVDLQKTSIEENFKRINDKISLRRDLKHGLPLGIYNVKNKINDLTGREWIKFTKSWFIHNPPPRNQTELLHPAKFPEDLIKNFISFFTKKGQLVLDPFLGTGSTAIAATQISRSCIGIEINKKYAEIARKRVSQKTLDKWIKPDNDVPKFLIFNEDANNIDKIWKRNNLPKIDFCITSPPYWNQLKRNSMRQKKRKDAGLDTEYSNNPKDIGNIDEFDDFIKAQKDIFQKVYSITKNNGYLVVITNNVFFDGKLYPLAHSTAISLSDTWVLKDEKIWCQDDKALLPLGIFNAWVANRCHQYCLVFRKEKN